MVEANALRRFVVAALSAVLAIATVAGTIIAALDVASARDVAIGCLSGAAIVGWSGALYVAYRSKNVVSDVERLLASIATEIPLFFTEAWLRSTLLSQRAIELYWRKAKGLRIASIEMSSEISATDITNHIVVRGRSVARDLVSSCPMLLIGGSVLQIDELPLNSSVVSLGGDPVAARADCVADLGQLKLLDVYFPTAIRPKDAFEVENTHSWPAAMIPGTDVMWYPYAAMFDEPVDRMTIEIALHSPAKFMRGYEARMSTGTCELTRTQPHARGAGGTHFRWEIEPVERDAIYALVFER